MAASMSSVAGNRLRLRDLPFLPLLLLLHLFFTVSSLFLRIYELLTRPENDLPPPKNDSPPRHVAIVFSTSSSSSSAAATSTAISRSKGRWTRDERAAFASVRSAVEWAIEEKVERISFYEHHGLLQQLEEQLVQALAPRPLSPPSSPPDSPGPRPDSSEGVPRTEEEWSVRTLSVFPSPRLARSPRWRQPQKLDASRDKTRQKPITVHLIPPSGELIPGITRSMIDDGVDVNDVTQDMINAQVEHKLQCPPPDLLIIHPLHQLSFPRSLLPRPAPELCGYPFWSLRITEIYQHPPPLPLSLLQPVLQLARKSTMPLIRKLGNLLPEPLGNCEAEGALERHEWEGAMRAWGEVEQRLGK